MFKKYEHFDLDKYLILFEVLQNLKIYVKHSDDHNIGLIFINRSNIVK